MADLDQQNNRGNNPQQNELNSGKGSGTNASIPKAILELPPAQLPKTVQSILDDLQQLRSTYKEQVVLEGRKYEFGKTIVIGTESDVSKTKNPHLLDAKELNFFILLIDKLDAKFNISAYSAENKEVLSRIAKTEPELRSIALSEQLPRLYIQTRRVSAGSPNEMIKVKIFDLETKQPIFEDFYSTSDNKGTYKVFQRTKKFLEEFEFSKNIKLIEVDSSSENGSHNKTDNPYNYVIKGVKNPDANLKVEKGLKAGRAITVGYDQSDYVYPINFSAARNEEAIIFDFQPRAIKITHIADKISQSFSNFLSDKAVIKQGGFPSGKDRYERPFIVAIESTPEGLLNQKFKIDITVLFNYDKMRKDEAGNYVLDFDLGIISATNKFLIKPFATEIESSGVKIRSDIENLNSPIFQPFLEGFISGAKEAYQFIGRKEFPIKNIYITKGDLFNGNFTSLMNDSLFFVLANSNLAMPEQAKSIFGKITGRHEAFHAIESEIKIEVNRSESDFETVHKKALTDPEENNDIFRKVNESNFFNLDTNLGHSADNPGEAFASLLNSLYQRDNWQQKLDQMTPIERSYYKEFLDGLKTKLEHIGVSFIGDNLSGNNLSDDNLSEVAKEIIKRTNYILEKDKK